jgi:hypothetical protein
LYSILRGRIGNDGWIVNPEYTLSRTHPALQSGVVGSIGWFRGRHPGTSFAVATTCCGIFDDSNGILISGGTFRRALGGDGSGGSPYQIGDVYGLQGIGSSGMVNRNYLLANNINAGAASSWNSGSGFVPIGNGTTAFTGTFNGQRYTVSNLVINRSTSDFTGLFGNVGAAGTIRNVGLIGATVTGGNYVGALVGFNYGTVQDVFVTGSGTVSGASSVGGLVGWNATGSITTAYSTVAVSGGDHAGGPVGTNIGTISQAYATGTVSGTDKLGGLIGGNAGSIDHVHATGAVSGNDDVGGLVGRNDSGPANISYAYAIGAVSGHDTVGGLVGNNAGTINQTYATGAVSGVSRVGGLIGNNWNAGGSVPGSVTQSYWDTATTGQASGFGSDSGTTFSATGLTTAEAFTLAKYSGFDFSSSGNWFMVDGQTRPFLRAEYATTITNTHQLQLVAMNLGASYTLGNDVDAGDASGSNPAGMWTSAGLVPLGNDTTTFAGAFAGAGKTISNLTINRPSENYVGLFGSSTAAISNLSLTNAAVSGQNYVGMLVGYQSGTITNSSAAGTVTGNYSVGGLAGYLDFGSISRSHATGVVNGNTGVGGLLGTIANHSGTIAWWDFWTAVRSRSPMPPGQ